MLIAIFGASGQKCQRTRIINWDYWNTLIVDLVLMAMHFVGR